MLHNLVLYHTQRQVYTSTSTLGAKGYLMDSGGVGLCSFYELVIEVDAMPTIWGAVGCILDPYALCIFIFVYVHINISYICISIYLSKYIYIYIVDRHFLDRPVYSTVNVLLRWPIERGQRGSCDYARPPTCCAT